MVALEQDSREPKHLRSMASRIRRSSAVWSVNVTSPRPGKGQGSCGQRYAQPFEVERS